MRYRLHVRVGTVSELWRFPVKSMGGERLEVADIEARGVRGDRLWALRDEELGAITSAKRTPAILMCAARYAVEPGPDAGPGAVPPVTIRLPDGTELSSDDPLVHERLSAFLGRRVTLSALRPASDRAYYRLVKPSAADMRAQFAVEADEPLPDFSMISMAKLMELGRYVTPPGTHFDLGALHIVTTATLATLRAKAPGSDFDVRRFRPNLLIDSLDADGRPDTGWEGAVLRAGTAAAHVDFPTVRCSMTIRPQPELAQDPRILKTVAAEAERCVGVYASVTAQGRVRVGDEVDVELRRTSRLGDWARARATGVKRALLRAALPKT
jgi:uncharacterized protein YcbX